MQASKKQFAAKQRRKGVQDQAEITRRWNQHRNAPSATIIGRGDYNTHTAMRPSLMRGRGDYKSAVRSAGRLIPKGTFAKGGRMLGTYLGGGLGGDVGSLGGTILSKLTGMGDYSVTHNSVMASAGGTGAHNSSFSSTGSSVVRVKRRECVGQISAPGVPPASGQSPLDSTVDPSAFNSVRYRIQGSNPDLFPWGSNVAQLYQEYEIKGCVFTLESTYSNYSAAGSLGTVCIATQYNAGDRPFDSMEPMLNSAFRSTGNPSQTIVHGLECDPKLQSSSKLLVRNKSNDSMTQAPNNYDFGFLTIATEGIPPAAAGGQIGRLYVTYDIEFSLPRTKDEILSIDNRLACAWSASTKGMGTNSAQTVGQTSPFRYWNVSFGGPSGNVPGGPGQTAADLNDENQLSIGTSALPNDICLFEPTALGTNTEDFQTPCGVDDTVLAWVTGTSPSSLEQICHLNFRYGGWVEITVMIPLLSSTASTAAVLPDDWWIPSYSVAGADAEDVDVTTSLSSFQMGILPAGPIKYTPSITWTIKFRDSAPCRRISFTGNTVGSPNELTTWMQLDNEPSPLPSFSVRFLGD